MEKRKDSKGRRLLPGENQRADGRYMYRHVDITGKRQTEYSWRLVESDVPPKGKKWDKSLREKEQDIAKAMADFISYKAGQMTLNRLFDLYIELRYRMKRIQASTYRNYKGIWDKHIRFHGIANTEINKLRKNDFLLLLQDLLNSGVGKGSIFLIHKIICAILNYAVSEDYIRKNFALGCIKEFDIHLQERQALTSEQQNQFLRYVASSKRYRNLYWTFIFMLETAIRASEMAGLTFDDIDEKEEYIKIDHQLQYKIVSKEHKERKLTISPPKTYRSNRSIPLSVKAKEALYMQRQYLKREGLLENFTVDGCKGFVFLTSTHKLWNINSLDYCLKSIVDSYNRMEMDKAKEQNTEPDLLPKITAHILRHTGCTRMAELGMDLRSLQMLMGHENLKITMKVYNHVDSIRMQNEIARIDNIRVKQSDCFTPNEQGGFWNLHQSMYHTAERM